MSRPIIIFSKNTTQDCSYFIPGVHGNTMRVDESV